MSTNKLREIRIIIPQEIGEDTLIEIGNLLRELSGIDNRLYWIKENQTRDEFIRDIDETVRKHYKLVA